MPRIKEGFKGERMVVLPAYLIEQLRHDPLGRELYSTLAASGDAADGGERDDYTQMLQANEWFSLSLGDVRCWCYAFALLGIEQPMVKCRKASLRFSAANIV